MALPRPAYFGRGNGETPLISQHPDTVEYDARRGPSDDKVRLVMALFARMDPVAMALAIGAVGTLGVFLATVILLLKGAPPGLPVGPHLSDLATFLPGYEVSWGGGMIGAVYGFLVGAAMGFVLAVLWNFAQAIVIGIAVLKGAWLD